MGHIKLFENWLAEEWSDPNRADLEKILPSIQAKIPKRYKKKKVEAKIVTSRPSNFQEDWHDVILIRCQVTPKRAATFAKIYGEDDWDLRDWENRFENSEGYDPNNIDSFSDYQRELIKVFDLIRRPDQLGKNGYPNAFTPKEFEKQIKLKMTSKTFGLD